MKTRLVPIGFGLILLALSANALLAAGSLPGLTASDRLVYQKLETTIVSFTFNEQPLEEAINFLATLGDVNIVIDRKKVEAGKTVTLKLTNVPLLTAVKLVTEQAGLKWIVREGVVFLSDEEGTKREPVTIVYDVADFLAIPPNFKGPNIELQSIGAAAARGGSGGSGGGGIFGGDSEEESDETDDSKKSSEELLKELVDLIKSVIEPGTWDADTGG